MTTVTFEKGFFFKSLACLAKRFSSTKKKGLELEKQLQITINKKEEFNRVLSCFLGKQKVQVTTISFLLSFLFFRAARVRIHEGEQFFFSFSFLFFLFLLVITFKKDKFQQ